MRSPFNKRFRGDPMPKDQQVRQGQVVRSAHAELKSAEAVRAFLNAHNGLLGGRPLDIATASDGGLARVERYMSALVDIRAAALPLPVGLQ